MTINAASQESGDSHVWQISVSNICLLDKRGGMYWSPLQAGKGIKWLSVRELLHWWEEGLITQHSSEWIILSGPNQLCDATLRSVDTAVEDRKVRSITVSMIKLLEQGCTPAGYLIANILFQGKNSACLCLHPALANWHLNTRAPQKRWLERTSGGFWSSVPFGYWTIASTRWRQPRLSAPGTAVPQPLW